MLGLQARIWRRRPIGTVAGVILAVLAVATVTASLWVSHSPSDITPVERLRSPSWDHWFGTDHFGRDVFSRVIYGARVSLTVGFVVAVLSTVLGAITGLIAGYYRRVDGIIMRIIDGVMAFPAILLAIALVAALGASLVNVIAALTFAFWPIMTRVVRASTLQLREMQYVEAARAVGSRDASILVTGVLFNALTPVIVQATFIFAESVLAEAALSFLGLGVDPTTPTWGNMLGESRTYLVNAPWSSIFPGLAIAITVLALNVFGDMLRDMLDPHAEQ